MSMAENLSLDAGLITKVKKELADYRLQEEQQAKKTRADSTRREERLRRYRGQEVGKIASLVEEIESKGIQIVRHGSRAYWLYLETPLWTISAIGGTSGGVESYRSLNIFNSVLGDNHYLLGKQLPHLDSLGKSSAVRQLLEYRKYTISGETSGSDLCRRELWFRMGWETRDPMSNPRRS